VKITSTEMLNRLNASIQRGSVFSTGSVSSARNRKEASTTPTINRFSFEMPDARASGTSCW